MLQSQNSKLNSLSFPRKPFSLFLVFGFILVAALVSAWRFAPSLAASKLSEKTNVRISQRDLANGTARNGSEYAERANRTLANPLFAAITVDRTDDVFAASACTVAANDCSLRGAVNFANLNPGTTINIPAGTYNLTISGAGEGFAGNDAVGDLDITASNTTIAGAGAATTIIHQTTAGDRVVEVNPFLDANFIASISDVTISGGTESTGVGGGGIISGAIGNLLTLTNCVVSGNSATGAGTFGGGGISHSGGSLTITGCTFSGNSTIASGAGIGYSAGDPFGRFPSVGTLRVSGSSFLNNTANSVAAGGGALDLFDFNLSSGSYLIDSTSFKNNTATNGAGGGIIVESGGPLTVTTSSFENNHAATRGGAVLSTGGVGSVRFSRFAGNSVTNPANGNTVFFSSGVFAADDDWWGVNSGPNPNDFRNSAGTVFPLTFLQLRASATPSTICSGSSSSISADIKQRNIGSPLTVELNGLPAFPASIVNGTPALGSLSGVSANFVNGAASATFNAGATPGTATIDITADSQSVTASVVIQANTTTDPADQALCAGSTATFTTTASGPGPFTFVWKKGATTLNNGDLGGRVTITSAGGSSSLSISNVQASDGDTYTVEATGACSTATQSATLTINAVTSTSTPTDQTVCQGTSATFSTTASGTGPFHYAWTVDGSASGGDSASLTVATGSLSVGNHTISVTTTGACGSDTKNAMLTVQQNTTASAVADQSVCQGVTASFSTTATGDNLHYAWTLDGSPFNGDNSSINVPTGSLSTGNHAVSVTVTGSCGSISRNATLTVRENTSATTPADQTVCQGANASFSTTATGDALHYAWTLDGSPFNGDNPSITVPTGSLSVGAHSVSVTVSGTCGNVTRNASLTVQANTATTDPPDQTVCQGATATFSTTASGTGPFHYAWTVDGSATGGDTASITVATGSLSVGNHAVSVTVTGACGSATQGATLTVNEPTSATTPADQTVCPGVNANFSTTASGTGPFHYAWTVDGSAFGGDTSSITVTTGSLSAGNHPVSVTVSGSCGSVIKNATLTVQQSTSTTTPGDQTVCQGTNANFSTTASGVGPFHYAWTVDGLASGGDSASLTVATGSLSVGSHTVSVTTTGTCGSDTKSATLNVQAPTSTTAPGDQTVCQGANASFSTSASGTGPFHYAWTVDGSATGGDAASITVATGSLSVGSHTVNVTVSGSCGSATQSATLTVNATTTATTPANQTVCPGVNANFSTTAGGTGPFHYAWTVDGSAVGGDSASVSVPTGSLSSGNHSVSVTVSGSCGSATKNATLTVTQSTTTSDPADQSVCLGGTASFTTNAAGTGPFSFVWKQGATVLSNGSLGGRVTIVSGASSSTLTITNVQAGDFGTYSVSTTGSCNTATQSANLSVNSTPPTITLNGNHISLWPPNHSYHTINVTDLVASATSCDGSVNVGSVVIDHVTSDEVENGNGDGNTLNDIVISCNRNSVQLRSERDGSGDGRVYTIYFKATDSMGHSTTVAATVTVPKSQNGNPAVDSGPHYTVSSATCP